MIPNLIDLEAFLRKHSVSNGGLFVIFGIIIWTFLQLAKDLSPIDKFFSFSLLASGFSCCWHYWINYYPKLSQNHYGVLVAIESENDEEKKKVKNDFIKRMADQVKMKDSSASISVCVLPEYRYEVASLFFSETADALNEERKLDLKNQALTSRIVRNIKKWEQFRKRRNYVLIVWGNVCKRTSQKSLEENVYCIRLRAIINHEGVESDIQEKISQDISNTISAQFVFPCSSELEMFDVSAEIYSTFAKFLIAVSLVCSKIENIETAISMFAEVENECSTFRVKGIVNYLHQRIPFWKSEGYRRLAYDLQLKGKWSEAFLKYKTAVESYPSNYAAWIGGAFSAFQNNDIPSAFGFISKAKSFSSGDGLWRYSHAFLHLFTGQFEIAVQNYNEAFESRVAYEKENVGEIIKHIESVAKDNPDKPQLTFAIAYINCKKVRNLSEAYVNFEKFITATAGIREYAFLTESAIRLKEQIEKEAEIK